MGFAIKYVPLDNFSVFRVGVILVVHYGNYCVSRGHVAEAELPGEGAADCVSIAVIADLMPGMLYIFGGTKMGHSKDPLSALNTYEYWDTQCGINGLCTSSALSLGTHKINILVGLQKDYGKHPIAKSMVETLLDSCDTVKEELGSHMEKLYRTLFNTDRHVTYH